MIMLDASIVNVAIPSMLRELHTNLNGIVWVSSVYLLTYAAPLMISGRLGDRFGRKQVFIAGMAIFTSASLACGLSTSIGPLIAARAVQGLGAAIMAPQTMAYVGHLFPADKRGAAMGAGAPLARWPPRPADRRGAGGQRRLALDLHGERASRSPRPCLVRGAAAQPRTAPGFTL